MPKKGEVPSSALYICRICHHLGRHQLFIFGRYAFCALYIDYNWDLMAFYLDLGNAAVVQDVVYYGNYVFSCSDIEILCHFDDFPLVSF